jgi:hypothetical protein
MAATAGPAAFPPSRLVDERSRPDGNPGKRARAADARRRQVCGAPRDANPKRRSRPDPTGDANVATMKTHQLIDESEPDELGTPIERYREP